MADATFRRSICWDIARLGRVMNEEAEQFSEAVFLATHHPMRMRRQTYVSAAPGDGAGRLQDEGTITEQQVLEEFMRDPDYTFLPVIGSAGSGKSHLIRWMASRIPEQPKRRVLRIPKIGLGLRGIIERVLEGMKGAQFEEYRRKLATTRMSLTLDATKLVLMDMVALGIGPQSPSGREPSGDRDRLRAEQWVRAQLPNLFYDPYFRKFFARKGGFIERLATHINQGAYDPNKADEELRFSDVDLPSELSDVYDHAGAAARQVYDWITDPSKPLRRIALEWLNEHLNVAIQMALNLAGSDIERLMIEVRQELGRQGVELIILVEDFARFQGIERQLLESLQARPQQEGMGRLCSLRVALACNEGFFNAIPETIRTRTRTYVHLDVQVDSGPKSAVTQQDVLQFAARYLNAARLPEGELEKWYERQRRRRIADEPFQPPPSSCSNCPHTRQCHEAFGAVGDVGLYPFTRTAFERMRHRVGGAPRFDPRGILQQVLRAMFEKYTGHLRDGRFPDPVMLQHFQGPAISAELKKLAQQRDPTNSERRLTLIDLWHDGRELVNLDPIIHQAFDLPELSTLKPGPMPPRPVTPKPNGDCKPPEPEPPQPVVPIPMPIDRRELAFLEELAQIDAWNAGQKKLSQELGQKLRKLIFPRLMEVIDWDSRLLAKEFFESSIVREASVNFVDGPTANVRPPVMLTLPLGHAGQDRLDTSLVFKALLRREHHNGWTFEDAAAQYRLVCRSIDQWAATMFDLIQKVGNMPDSKSGDGVFEAAVEATAIGQCLLGYPIDLAKPAAAVEILFGQLPIRQGLSVSDSWRELQEDFIRRRAELIDIIKAYACATKGGGLTLQIVDAATILKALGGVAEHWRPSVLLPTRLPTVYDGLGKFHTRLTKDLPRSMKDQKVLLLEWRKDAVDLLGEPVDWKAIRTSLAATKQALSNACAWGRSVTPQALDETFETMVSHRKDVEACLALVQRIETLEDGGEAFIGVCRGLVPEIGTVKAFLETIKELVKEVGELLDDRRENANKGGQLKAAVTAASEELKTVADLLRDLPEGVGQ